MKTRVNGIPKIQEPCPWRRFGRSSKKRRNWDTTFYMLILFSILIVSLKDVLSRTHVNRKCVFCILGQYSAEQYDAQIFGQRVLLRPVVIEIWVSWHIKQDKGLSSYWRAWNAFAWAPYWKKKRRDNVEPKLNRKKKCTVGTICHNANGNG